MPLDLSVSKSKAGLLQPPPGVRGMTCLDRKGFSKVIKMRCLTAGQNLHNILSLLKPFLLKIVSFKPTRTCHEDPDKKDIFLNPETVQKFEDFPENVRQKLNEFGYTANDLIWKDLTLEYENWKVDEILKSVLPLEASNVTGFSVVGHIVHLNLKEEHTEYKNLIGSVLLDKLKNIRTVVNKLNTIDNTFRNFEMEVLAGDNDTVVTVKENGILFRFDFARVYWNPRLSTEHNRLVAKLKPNDTLFDVFAGVGPFSVPAGRKKCTVFANDLNPESTRWLSHNVDINKVRKRVIVSTLDGREFIQRVARPEILRFWKTGDIKQSIHIVMNLPALAIEFLDVFPSLFTEDNGNLSVDKLTMPFVHCYCFVKDVKDYKNVAQTMAEEQLNCSLIENNVEVTFVRNVAPNKDMVRISFQFSEEILFRKINDDEPKLKKVKLEG